MRNANEEMKNGLRIVSLHAVQPHGISHFSFYFLISHFSFLISREAAFLYANNNVIRVE